MNKKTLFALASFALINHAPQAIALSASSVTPVAVVADSPFTSYSEKLSVQMLAMACSMGFPGGNIDGTNYGTCPDFSEGSQPFNNPAFLSGFIYTNLLSTPLSLTTSNLYQVSSDSDSEITVESLTTEPSPLLNYQSPSSDLGALTNSIFLNNGDNSDWWYDEKFDVGYFSAANSTDAQNSFTNSLDSAYAANYQVSESEQSTYLGNPTALAVFNMMNLPFSCLDSSNTDQYCFYSTVFPFVQKGAVGQAYNVTGDPSVTISDTVSAYTSITNLSQNLPNATNQLQALPTLNADTLLSPLMYKQNLSTIPGTAETPFTAAGAQNELESATDFVKYVTGQFLPLQPTSNSDFVGQSLPTIYTYIAMLRTYISQWSMATSNLNFLLAKRIQPKVDGQPQISQSAYEYNMATRRLQTNSTNTDSTNDCSGGANSASCQKTWMQQIKGMTSAQQNTQMLELLAEMNYQLYLNRQIMERLLAVNSVSLASSVGYNKSSITLDSAKSLGCYLTTGAECPDSSSDDDSSS